VLFSQDWFAEVEIFNLLETSTGDIDYYYASRLPGEPATGVNDTHPSGPREFWLSVTRML